MKTQSFFFVFLVFFTAKAAAISPITGITLICSGNATTLGNATPGGTWSSGTIGVATIGSSSGVVTGISAGTTTITYATSSETAIVVVTVNPTPSLSSSLTPPSLCDSSLFNYTPTSSTAGTTFLWTRAAIPGISIPSSSGTGNPNEMLVNISPLPIGVIYSFTLTASGCTNIQAVVVSVNPTPRLSSTHTPPSICDTNFFNYIPTSASPISLYTWNRPAVAGITPLTNFASTGSGEIHEPLYNATAHPIAVNYIYRLANSGCINLFFETVTVIVNPCSPSAVEDVSGTNKKINIYPNPTRGAFTIETNELNANATIILSDVLGNVIEKKEVLAPSLILNPAVQPGVYIVQIITDGAAYSEKITIW